jgi:DNA-binding beta-propeller fold protein YncE
MAMHRIAYALSIIVFLCIVSLNANAQVLAYIGYRTDDSVSVVDISNNNNFIASVPSIPSSEGSDISPDGRYFYASSVIADGILSVIRTSDNTLTAVIPVESAPVGVVTTPDGQSVYVVNNGPGTISEISVPDFQVLETFDITNGADSVFITITPDGQFMYVTNQANNLVNVFRTSDNSHVTDIDMGSSHQRLDVTPDGAYVYVSVSNSTVGVIRTSDNSLFDSIPLSGNPRSLVITPDGAFAYVALPNIDSVEVIRISDNTVIKTIGVGDSPKGLDVTPDGQFVYCVNESSKNVSVIRVSDNTMVNTFNGPFPGTVGPFILTLPQLPTASIPTLSEWGMIAAAAGLGIVGLFFVARRKRISA